MAFPTTHWSLLDNVQGEKTPNHLRALEELAVLYRDPAYRHIIAKGYRPQEAENLVQEFFFDWLERELFSRADRQQGRFRSYFLTILDRFLSKQYRYQQAQKRKPEGGFAEYLPEALAGGDSPEAIFERAYETNLLREVLTQVSVDFQNKDMKIHIQLFNIWFVEPILDGVERPSQERLAQRFALTEKQVSNMMTTVKRKYRQVMELRIREFAMNEEDVQEELRALMGY